MDIGDNAQMTSLLSSSLLLSNKSVADKMIREHLQVKYKNILDIKIYIMRRVYSLENSLMLGGIGGRRRRG